MQPLLILWGLIIIALGLVFGFIPLGDQSGGSSSLSGATHSRWVVRLKGVPMLLIGSGLLIWGIRR